MRSRTRLSLLVLVAVTLPGAAFAGERAVAQPAKQRVFRGKGHYVMATVDKRGKSRVDSSSLPSAFSFALHGSQVRIDMQRGENWSQIFDVKSDRTENGIRTIEYQRPAHNSLAAKQNLRHLNGGWWTRPLGAYGALRGSGTIKIRGDHLSWDQNGSGSLRVLWKRQEANWVESFEGKSE